MLTRLSDGANNEDLLHYFKVSAKSYRKRFHAFKWDPTETFAQAAYRLDHVLSRWLKIKPSKT